MDKLSKSKTAKKIKNRTVAGLAGVLAGISVAFSGLVSPDDDLISGNDYEESVHNPGNITTLERVPSSIRQIPLPQKYSLADRMRLWIWKLPPILKILVVCPLWIVGKLITWAVTGAAQLLGPVAPWLVGILLRAALLFLFFAAIMKFLYPDRKITEILKGRKWIYYLAGALLLTGADAVLKSISEPYRIIRVILSVVILISVLAVIYMRLFPRNERPTVQEKWIEIPENV